MKIKQILTEGWYINVSFPVNVDEFNRIMNKHGVSIQWETRKGRVQPSHRRMAWLQMGNGEDETLSLELSVTKHGMVTSATGRAHNIAGGRNRSAMKKLEKLLTKEFGNEWEIEDESEE